MTQTARQQQPQPQQTQPVDGSSIFEELLKKDFVRTTEYTPFLGSAPLKLNPGIIIKYLCKPTRAGAVCTEEQAMRFQMLCKSRGLNPWEGDAFLVGYDTKDGPEFNLITSHQAFLKRAEINPEYDGMESGVFVRDNETGAEQEIQGDYIPEGCTLLGGWCRVHHKTRKYATYRRLDVKVFDKGFAQWITNKGGMIVKCTEADGLRSAFPNSLGGMYIDGEMPDAPRAEPATSAADWKKKYEESLRAANSGNGGLSAPVSGTGTSHEPMSKDAPSPDPSPAGNAPAGTHAPAGAGASPTGTAPAPRGRPGRKADPTPSAPPVEDRPVSEEAGGAAEQSSAAPQGKQLTPREQAVEFSEGALLNEIEGFLAANEARMGRAKTLAKVTGGLEDFDEKTKRKLAFYVQLAILEKK